MMKLPLIIALFMVVALLGCSSTGMAQRPGALDFEAFPKYEEGGPITAPKAVSRVEPVPSREFREKHSFVEAKIEAVVNEEGKVIGCRYVSGDREWAQVVAYSVAKWRFDPALMEGSPIAVRYSITSTFRRNP